MKGPNPFVLWEYGTSRLAGRKNETAMFRSFLNGISGGSISSVLVSGSPGLGKSALLARFHEIAEKTGFYPVAIRAAKGETADSLLERAFGEFSNYLDGLVAKGTLSEKNAMRIKGKGDLFVSPGTLKGIAEGIVVFVDDASRMRNPEGFARMIAGKAKTTALLKTAFVLASARDMDSFRGLNMKLAPFDGHDMQEMVQNALGKDAPKVGQGCLDTILDESEGNPRIAKTMFYAIYESLGEKEKIIARKHYIVNFARIIRILTSEFFEPLWQSLPDSEKELVAAISRAGGQAHISDMAKILGKRHATTLALRLERKGQLVRIDRGIYRVFTKLYGKYAIQRTQRT